MERKRYLVGDDVQAKRAALGKLIVSLEMSKGQAKVKYTFPLACAGLYGVPPGRCCTKNRTMEFGSAAE